MAYSGDLLRLNGTSYRCIKSYKVGRNKLWSSDTGRTMAGNMEGTLVGNFPKIMLEIEPIDEAEMSQLENLFDQALITVDYYNAKYNGMCRGNFYANDYEEEVFIERLPTMKYKSFAINLISIESEASHVRVN